MHQRFSDGVLILICRYSSIQKEMRRLAQTLRWCAETARKLSDALETANEDLERKRRDSERPPESYDPGDFTEPYRRFDPEDTRHISVFLHDIKPTLDRLEAQKNALNPHEDIKDDPDGDDGK